MRTEPSDERGQADAAEQVVIDRYDRISGRRDWERQRGVPLPVSPPYFRGQVAAPAPIPFDSLPPYLGAVGGGRAAPVLRGAWLSRQPRPLRAVGLIAGVLLAILLALRGRA